MNAFLGILITAGYIFAILGLAELLRYWRGYSSAFTRKVIHIGVGMWSWALPAVFDSPWPFVWACLLFTVLLYIDWRYRLFPAMASQDKNNLGTVYFPLAAAAAVIVLWDWPPLMVAALMPLTWGDGLAPVIGRAYGRHPYTVFGHTRSLQGSVGFFVFGPQPARIGRLFRLWPAVHLAGPLDDARRSGHHPPGRPGPRPANQPRHQPDRSGHYLGAGQPHHHRRRNSNPLPLALLIAAAAVAVAIAIAIEFRQRQRLR
jgi:dolichol kinase